MRLRNLSCHLDLINLTHHSVAFAFSLLLANMNLRGQMLENAAPRKNSSGPSSAHPRAFAHALPATAASMDVEDTKKPRPRKGKVGQVISQANTKVKSMDEKLEELSELKDEINQCKGMWPVCSSLKLVYLQFLSWLITLILPSSLYVSSGQSL